MNHGLSAGPVALVVAAVLAATAAHCAVSAARRGRGGGLLRRLADADHAVTGLVMVAMVAPGLVPGVAAALSGPGPVVLLGALAVAWAAVAVRDLADGRSGCSPGASGLCGSHPLHLVAVNAAMAVMLLPGVAGSSAAGPAASPMAGHAMAGMPGHGVAGGGGGPAGVVLVVGLALGLWFVVHAVRTLTAGTGTAGRRVGQAVMSAGMAGMLLLAAA